MGEELQKFGILFFEIDVFVEVCKEQYSFDVCGLMCILFKDDEFSLYFVFLKKIVDRNLFNFISMGMSVDFEFVVEFGVMYIWVGILFFGMCEINVQVVLLMQDYFFVILWLFFDVILKIGCLFFVYQILLVCECG